MSTQVQARSPERDELTLCSRDSAEPAGSCGGGDGSGN